MDSDRLLMRIALLSWYSAHHSSCSDKELSPKVKFGAKISAPFPQTISFKTLAVKKKINRILTVKYLYMNNNMQYLNLVVL